MAMLLIRARGHDYTELDVLNKIFRHYILHLMINTNLTTVLAVRMYLGVRTASQ
jgi:hypothetical protein